MSEILDSGARREFSSGAVRDVQEGKGRCDLLPLSVVAEVMSDNVLCEIDIYVRTGDYNAIVRAIQHFCRNNKMDLCTAMLEVAKHYEQGAKKYTERNWEKGIDLHCYIDSGVRHYLKYKRGDTDEPHDRAFIWNMLCAIWTQTCRPECIDLPYKKVEPTPKSEEATQETKRSIKIHRETCFG